MEYTFIDITSKYSETQNDSFIYGANRFVCKLIVFEKNLTVCKKPKLNKNLTINIQCTQLPNL